MSQPTMYGPYVPSVRIRPIVQEYLSRPDNTQETLSALTGVPVRRIYEILNQEKQLRFDTADKILTGLGMINIWYTELEDLYRAA